MIHGVWINSICIDVYTEDTKEYGLVVHIDSDASDQ